MRFAIAWISAPARRTAPGASRPARAVRAIRVVSAILILGQLGACTGSTTTPTTAAAPQGKAKARLELVSTDELSFTGESGSYFEPARGVCTVRNAGGVDILWTAESSAAWLQIQGPVMGTLRPQASLSVGVSVDALATRDLAAGTHEAEVRFQIPGDKVSLCRRKVILHTTEAPPSTQAMKSISGAADYPADTPSEDASDAAGTLAAASVPGLAADEPGWTRLQPSAGTRAVYVSSSSGDDRHDGRSPTSAKRTLAAGIALLRNRSPDWLLLRRGDAWNESLGQWTKSGRSPTEPMVVTGYGESPERPLLRTGAGKGLWTSAANSAPPTIESVSFIGLHLLADGFQGTGDCDGIQLLQPVRHLLIEDCVVQGYGTNLVFQGFGGRHADITLRRSVIVDAFATHGAGHPEGLYASQVDGLTIEENLFDHNGWSETHPNAGPDIFSHNLYIDNGNTKVVVRGNIISNASSHGMQLRCGGQAMDNLFVRNSIALSVGGGNDPERAGVQADVRLNVFLDGKDIDRGNPRGWALWFANIASGEVSGNLIAHDPLSNLPFALTLDGDHVGDERSSIGIHDLRITGNVFYDWGGGILVEGDARQLTDIVFEGNDFQEPRPDVLVGFSDPTGIGGLSWSNNRCHGRAIEGDAWIRIGHDATPRSQWPAALADLARDDAAASYPEPQRDVPSYCHSLGQPGTLEAFLAQARLQSRARWLPEFTAAEANRYMRGGFGLSSP